MYRAVLANAALGERPVTASVPATASATWRRKARRSVACGQAWHSRGISVSEFTVSLPVAVGDAVGGGLHRSCRRAGRVGHVGARCAMTVDQLATAVSHL